MMNKKGVDAVVATVLIIMITVAAVAIIYLTVIPMIKNTAQQGTTCFNAQKDLQIVTESYTCANSSIAMVQINKGTNAEVTNISVQWIAAGSTLGTAKSEAAPSINGAKVYYNSSAITTVPTSVRISPIVTVGQSTQTCEPLADVDLPKCA